MTAAMCSHLEMIAADAAPSSEGCEDCIRIGSSWMHLRRCTTYVHIGCCDSSPMRHATKQVKSSDHPLVQSFEPGEDWLYVDVDAVAFEIESMLGSPSHP